MQEESEVNDMINGQYRIVDSEPATESVSREAESILDRVLKATAAEPRKFSYNEMNSMADTVAKSGLGKMNASQILTLMLVCDAEGRHPIEAIRRYHFFDGKIAMRSDAMMADFQHAKGVIKWVKDTTDECEALFSHPVHYPEPHKVSFSMADARRAGLANKTNWQNHPRSMLRARVITNGIRMVLPAVVAGIYTEDEIDEVATPAPSDAESSARDALIGKLKSKLENPEGEPKQVSQEATPETVAEVAKPSQAPQSEWGKWLVEQADAFNKDMAPAPPVKSQQIANHLVNEGIAAGTVNKEAVETGGKRDNKKVAAALQYLWERDANDLMDRVGKYLAAKATDYAHVQVGGQS
jgi:hypothetical protein